MRAAAPFQPIPLASAPTQMLAGDFTGDGHLDLVATDSAGIQMLLGNGDGTFQPAETVATLGVGGFSQQTPLVAGDFNGDGRLDLAAVGTDSSGAGEVLVLLGNGDGTFQPAIESALGAGNYGHPYGPIVAGDFTGDGRDDLAVAGAAESLAQAGVSVLLANGDGTFQPARTFAVGGGLTVTTAALVEGDFNGDGRLDLAALGRESSAAGEVSVLLGNGNGTFQPQVTTYPVGIDALSMVAGDFTGNGRDDLAVSDQDGVQMLLSNGDGTFQPAETVAAGIEEGPLVAGDFNGDRRLDLAGWWARLPGPPGQRRRHVSARADRRGSAGRSAGGGRFHR